MDIFELMKGFLFNISVLLIWVMIIKWLFTKIFKNKESHIKDEIVEHGYKKYKKKIVVMNDSEMALFQALLSGLPDNYFVFPKMRIADMVDVVNGSGYYQRRNQILPKHVDFLICNDKMTPLVAIELDGGSHNKPSRIERDQLVDGVFEDAELTLKRIEVGSNFRSIVSDIVQELKA